MKRKDLVIGVTKYPGVCIVLAVESILFTNNPNVVIESIYTGQRYCVRKDSVRLIRNRYPSCHAAARKRWVNAKINRRGGL